MLGAGRDACSLATESIPSCHRLAGGQCAPSTKLGFAPIPQPLFVTGGMTLHSLVAITFIL